MAEPIPFLGVNKELQPDKSHDDYSLPVFQKGSEWVSCWLLDEDEIKTLCETGRIWVRVKGKIHPYIKLGVEQPFDE